MRTKVKATKHPKSITRMDIVEDCLRLLDTKKFRARNGVYLELNSNICEVFPGKSLQKVMHSKKWKPCEGCQLGLMFMARVDLENKVNIPNDELSLSRQSKMMTHLEDLFPEVQLRLIEAAFEMQPMGVGGAAEYFRTKPWDQRERDAPYQTLLAAVEFGTRYENATQRMRAILKNMKGNDGYFNPPPKPLPLLLQTPAIIEL
jgi:hypothetical protein